MRCFVDLPWLLLICKWKDQVCVYKEMYIHEKVDGKERVLC